MPSHRYGLNCAPLAGSSVEALIPNVTTFGGGASMEVIKATEGRKGGALIQYVCVLTKGGRDPEIRLFLPLHPQVVALQSVCVCAFIPLLIKPPVLLD